MRRRSIVGGLVSMLVALGGATGVVRASAEPGPLALQVELLEQAACLVGRDGYRVAFEMRTIYVNTGRAPVFLAFGDERIVRASFTPVGDAGLEADTAVSFAGAAESADPAAGQPARAVSIEPGWAVSSRAIVWVPLTTGGSDAASLMPGRYTAGFEVSAMFADAAADTGAGGTPTLRPLRLSTPPLAVTIDDPSQVQECGSFSEGLKPASERAS